MNEKKKRKREKKNEGKKIERTNRKQLVIYSSGGQPASCYQDGLHGQRTVQSILQHNALAGGQLVPLRERPPLRKASAEQCIMSPTIECASALLTVRVNAPGTTCCLHFSLGSIATR